MESRAKSSRVLIVVTLLAVAMLTQWPGDVRFGATLLAQSSVTADPTKLPVATTSQLPLTAAYTALNVPGITPGGFYLDPTTGVKIYKLTSPTFPTTQANFSHDYGEGGNEVSLPYTGQTRAVHVGTSGLLDFTPGGSVGNYRTLSGSMKPAHDGCFTFSSNPATPYYAYVLSTSALVRIDIRTMTLAPGGGFPVTTSGGWLHQSGSDTLFTWLSGTTTVMGYQPSTGILRSTTDANTNEPRILRGGRYIGISLNGNGAKVWDFETDTIIVNAGSGIPFAHQASLDDRWLGTNWNLSYPNKFWELVPATLTFQNLTGPTVDVLTYANGNWVQPGAGANAWALVSSYGNSTNQGWLAPRGMVYVNSAGGRRLLGHPYNNSQNYTYYSFVKQAIDGRYVLFTSDMNGSGRSDLFLVEVPTTASSTDTTPPTVSMTAPASSTTLTGSATVSASASDDTGVIGVQFRANGANIGSEVTNAPYAINWNSASVSDGAYNLTAIARDAAGNSTTSAPVAVTVANTPPAISSVASSSITASAATISWTTNQSSDSQVEYGPTTAYGTATSVNAAMVTAHVQALSGLSQGTTYHYRVKSRNVQGALATSGDFTFTTVGPPTISSVAAGSLTATSATITWNTNQAADSQIDYGLTTSYGSSTGIDTLLVTSHGKTLTNLAASTSYHYRVKSRNVAGLLTTSGDFVFTTTSGGGSSFSLSVTLEGRGTGTVVAPLAGINCGTQCSGMVASGTPVTLTAMPARGSAFSRWGGACAGSSRTCTLNITAAATVTARFTRSARRDFDGDGFADLIWQKKDGTLALWTMQGTERVSASDIAPQIISGGADWQIVDPAAAGTGPTDAGTGATGLPTWRHAGPSGLLSAVYLTVQSRIADVEWEIVATPDLDGDGRADVLWQHATTGKLAAWIMDGPVKTSASFLVPDSVDPGSGWHVQGAGDFNDDGKPDIVFQQLTTGALNVWFMDGTIKIGEQALSPGPVPMPWRMVGAGDFDLDGHTDLVWQNPDTADVYVWLMNGTSMRLEQSVGRFDGPEWQVCAVGDFDGDESPDLVWQKETGELAAWFMTGTTLKSSAPLLPGSVDPAWRIKGGN